MLRIIFIFLFFLHFSSSYSQIQSGEVIYKVKEMDTETSPDSLKTKNPAAYGYFAEKNRKIKTALPYLQFKLMFNSNESHFERIQSMELDIGKDMEAATRRVRGPGVYYTDIDNKKQFHQFELLGDLWLIEVKLDTIDWEIQKEYKEIKGHKVRKATATIPLNPQINGKVIAWFTSEIPFQVGPIGISGLPGLILEYQINHYMFYADKIKLSKKEKNIRKPIKGKRATEQEYTKKLMNQYFGD